MSIITISRGTYLGGQALARSLAERLGYRCISREDVLDAATVYGVQSNELAAAMDKPPSLWERLVGQRTTHLAFFRAALCERVREGNVVYHGFAGHLILAGVSHVIRVRAIGEMEFRVRIAMEQRNISHREALALIEKVDRERKEWARFLFGVEWDDPSLYDVVVNLGRLTPASACDTVARMVEYEEFKPTAASLEAMDDLVLGSLVSAALAKDENTTAADLKVTVDAGVVTISGSSQSQTVIEAIPIVAGRIEGVKEVRCQVTARPIRYEGV